MRIMKIAQMLPEGTVVRSNLYHEEGNIDITGMDDQGRYNAYFPNSGKSGKLDPGDISEIVSLPSNFDGGQEQLPGKDTAQSIQEIGKMKPAALTGSPAEGANPSSNPQYSDA